MYQNNPKKRYDVNVVYNGGSSVSYKNVELIVCEPNYLRVRDEDGNEHFFTGAVGITADEIKK